MREERLRKLVNITNVIFTGEPHHAMEHYCFLGGRIFEIFAPLTLRLISKTPPPLGTEQLFNSLKETERLI